MKRSSELTLGQQPALKYEPSEISGLVDFVPLSLVPLQSPWVQKQTSPTPKRKPVL